MSASVIVGAAISRPRSEMLRIRIGFGEFITSYCNGRRIGAPTMASLNASINCNLPPCLQTNPPADHSAGGAVALFSDQQLRFFSTNIAASPVMDRTMSIKGIRMESPVAGVVAEGITLKIPVASPS